VTAHSLLEVTLFVRDVDASAAFYRALGVGLFSVTGEPRSPYYYEGSVGDVAVQIYPAGAGPITRVQLAFRGTSIDEVEKRLEAQGTPYESPVPKTLSTYDPDGNRVHMSEVQAT
jgi:catechol 2,3-dioxygenase-like lactoylglutathione lyase family enzyme